MSRRPTLTELVLAVDLLGLLVLDVFLISMLFTESGDRWHRLRQEMVLLCSAAVLLDGFALFGPRWAWLLRLGLAFGIASTMLAVFMKEPEGLSLTIAIYQAGLILLGGWRIVHR